MGILSNQIDRERVAIVLRLAQVLQYNIVKPIFWVEEALKSTFLRAKSDV
jgi:hypothetical protein